MNFQLFEDKNFLMSTIEKVRALKRINNCWICEGWREIKFSYKPEFISEEMNDGSVSLHLSFENYIPSETTFQDGLFVSHRMCPPGDLFFYFTMNKVPVVNFPSEMVVALSSPIYHTVNDHTEEKIYKLEKVCKIEVLLNNSVISEAMKSNLEYCVPRPEPRKINKKKIRIPWVFEISCWYNYGLKYEGESDDFFRQMFENDVKRFNLAKDAKDTKIEDKVRKILLENYKQMFYSK